MKTLDEAKLLLEQNLEAGTDCPCCGRWAKMYKRQVYGTLVDVMFSLHKMMEKNPQQPFFHLDEFIHSTTGVSFTLTLHWGLTERSTDVPEGKQTSGYWRLTPKGIQFLQGAISIPKYVRLYNNEVLGFEGAQVTVQDVLGEKFDYEKLMAD